ASTRLLPAPSTVTGSPRSRAKASAARAWSRSVRVAKWAARPGSARVLNGCSSTSWRISTLEPVVAAQPGQQVLRTPLDQIQDPLEMVGIAAAGIRHVPLRQRSSDPQEQVQPARKALRTQQVQIPQVGSVHGQDVIESTEVRGLDLARA